MSEKPTVVENGCPELSRLVVLDRNAAEEDPFASERKRYVEDKTKSSPYKHSFAEAVGDNLDDERIRFSGTVHFNDVVQCLRRYGAVIFPGLLQGRTLENLRMEFDAVMQTGERLGLNVLCRSPREEDGRKTMLVPSLPTSLRHRPPWNYCRAVEVNTNDRRERIDDIARDGRSGPGGRGASRRGPQGRSQPRAANAGPGGRGQAEEALQISVPQVWVWTACRWGQLPTPRTH